MLLVVVLDVVVVVVVEVVLLLVVVKAEVVVVVTGSSVYQILKFGLSPFLTQTYVLAGVIHPGTLVHWISNCARSVPVQETGCR
jgi:hypothetical protein